MSIMQPVGPEPSGVYWRRRLIVLGAVVLLILAVWFLFFRGRGGGGGSAQPTPAPTSTSTSTGTAKPTDTASPSGSSSEETPVCEDSAITVAVSLKGTSFAAGSDVPITQSIKNSGSTACRRDIGAKANTIAITSGGYPVWSSDDCSPGGASNIVVMKPGDEYQVTVSWKGQLTEGSCPKNPPTAQAGGYDVAGKNGAVESKSKAFALT